MAQHGSHTLRHPIQGWVPLSPPARPELVLLVWPGHCPYNAAMRLHWFAIALIGVGSLTACAQPEPTATPTAVPEIPPPAVPALIPTAAPALTPTAAPTQRPAALPTPTPASTATPTPTAVPALTPASTSRPTPAPIDPASEAQGISNIFQCGNDANCMDTAAGTLLQTRNTRELLAELDELGKQDTQVLVQCHPIVHAIGRMSYKLSGNVGDAFQLCDHTCHSGCFHGIMERIFVPDQPLAEGVTTIHIPPEVVREKVPTICEEFGIGLEGNTRFQCLHGLGHAVMFFLNYDLIVALDTCDALSSRWDQRSCYGGVFMENVVAVDKDKRYLSDEPHYPCNVIEDKYITDCYGFQTSRMLELGLSYEQIGEECEEAGNYRNTCLVSLGRDASNDARADPKSANICTSLVTKGDTRQCMKGLVYALADNSLDGRYAYPYCDNLGDDHTTYCYQTTISYLLNSLYIPQTTVTESCERYSTKPDCRDIVAAAR